MKTASFVSLVSFAASLALAAEPATQPARSYLISDYSGGKVVIYRDGGGIVWQHKAGGPYDVCMRPNGNVVYAGHGFVEEVVPDLKAGGGKVLWTYKAGAAEPASTAKCEVHSCQVQPDGAVVTAEAGSKRLVYIDPGGKVVKTVPFETAEPATHQQVRMVRRGEEAGQWLALMNDGLARQIDEKGKVLRDVAVRPADRKGNGVYEVLPLGGGKLLCSLAGQQAVAEFDADGRKTWEFTNADAEGQGVKMAWVSGISRTPAGTVLVAMYQSGNTVKAFEVNREKKVLWKLDASQGIKGPSGIKLIAEGHASPDGKK